MILLFGINNNNMEKIEVKETIYICRFKTKNVIQKISVTNRNVPFKYECEFQNCVTDLKDLQLLHEFLGELIKEKE